MRWVARRADGRRSSPRSKPTCSIASTPKSVRRSGSAVRCDRRTARRLPRATRWRCTLDGKIGRVLELRGKDASIVVGSMKLTVSIATLRKTERPAETAVSYVGDAPEVFASTEVNLLGLRADEAEGVV